LFATDGQLSGLEQVVLLFFLFITGIKRSFFSNSVWLPAQEIATR